MDARSRFIQVFFIALLGFVFFQVGMILSPFLQPLFWSAVVAYAFYPLHERIRRGVANEHLAAGLSTLVIILLLVPVVAVLAIKLTSESVRLYRWILRAFEQGQVEQWTEQFLSLPAVVRVETLIKKYARMWDARIWLREILSAAGQFAAAQAGAATKGLIQVVAHFILLLFFLFFFFRDGHRIARFLYEITPLEELNKRAVFDQINETLSAVLRGQIVTSIVQAILLAFTFLFLGLPLPFLFGLLAFLASLVPVIGASSVWVPWVVYLFFQGDVTRAVILLLLGAFVISLVDNILKPWLIGEKTKLPYLLLFLGILGGMKMYGLIGVFLAPVVLSLFFVLVRIYRESFWK